jgi:hypothetical protein
VDGTGWRQQAPAIRRIATVAYITIAVEGLADEPVVRKILATAGHDVAHAYVLHGKHTLDRSLPGYNNAARHAPWLVLRDLDHDADCAPTLLGQLLPQPAALMRFRIAVRALEAWLLADAGSLSRFIGVSSRFFPPDPDALEDPKLELVNLVRRSRSRALGRIWCPQRAQQGRSGQHTVRDSWSSRLRPGSPALLLNEARASEAAWAASSGYEATVSRTTDGTGMSSVPTGACRQPTSVQLLAYSAALTAR